MKKTLIALAIISAPGIGFAQVIDAQGRSSSDAGAVAQTGNITFEGSPYPSTQRVHTTPPVYVAPSMFGPSNNNCGVSDTMSVSVTGFGIGGSKASESDYCNTRQDVATAWNLGLHDVARMRFLCFGEDVNRKAYESVGGICPSSATATGIAEAQVGPAIMASAQVQETIRMRVNPDGTVTQTR